MSPPPSAIAPAVAAFTPPATAADAAALDRACASASASALHISCLRRCSLKKYLSQKSSCSTMSGTMRLWSSAMNAFSARTVSMSARRSSTQNESFHATKAPTSEGSSVYVLGSRCIAATARSNGVGSGAPALAPPLSLPPPLAPLFIARISSSDILMAAETCATKSVVPFRTVVLTRLLRSAPSFVALRALATASEPSARLSSPTLPVNSARSRLYSSSSTLLFALASVASLLNAAPMPSAHLPSASPPPPPPPPTCVCRMASFMRSPWKVLSAICASACERGS
mmetsp:Transcript_2868/g.11558  ORF Transcript_2868/g.11558 Transcript_2868/m.11558 type:complete len:285 (-) Transcript_2868:264-1118(-)